MERMVSRMDSLDLRLQRAHRVIQEFKDSLEKAKKTASNEAEKLITT